MKAYQDPRNPGNGPKYRTGRECVERGCTNPAGTAWSRLWCMPCNVKRMDKIDANLREMLAGLEAAASGVPVAGKGRP